MADFDTPARTSRPYRGTPPSSSFTAASEDAFICSEGVGMLGHFFFWLLKAKVGVFTVFTASKIPLIATLLVLGTTGFVVTGTIEGDEDDDRTVNLIIHPLESKTCIDALIAQTEALLEVDMLAADAKVQLRHMRDR